MSSALTPSNEPVGFFYHIKDSNNRLRGYLLGTTTLSDPTGSTLNSRVLSAFDEATHLVVPFHPTTTEKLWLVFDWNRTKCGLKISRVATDAGLSLVSGHRLTAKAASAKKPVTSMESWKEQDNLNKIHATGFLNLSDTKLKTSLQRQMQGWKTGQESAIERCTEEYKVWYGASNFKLVYTDRAARIADRILNTLDRPGTLPFGKDTSIPFFCAPCTLLFGDKGINQNLLNHSWKLELVVPDDTSARGASEEAAPDSAPVAPLEVRPPPQPRPQEATSGRADGGSASTSVADGSASDAPSDAESKGSRDC